MYYVSTRDKLQKVAASAAIAYGLSPDGGLYTPEAVPSMASIALDRMKDMTYQQRVVYLMSVYLDGYSAAELAGYAAKAYGGGKFDDSAVAPVRQVRDGVYALELWHGPTCAFKDLALQMLPYLLTAALRKEGEKRTACVLAATSGDTGKAALEGFRDVPGTRVLVFYPKDGVAAIQELQMTTQEGNNVGVCAVEGNFDVAQAEVKRIFADPALREELSGRGAFLTSANSINWGRVLPQIVYYVSAYCDMMKSGAIQKGDRVNVCVPTGNFGDILAAWFAKRMGLPLGRLICASNQNNVLTDFIRTGVYDRNRPFYRTISPSMDILVSSNLERLIHAYAYGDDQLVKRYMDDLAQTGRYQVSGDVKRCLDREFSAYCCDDKETGRVIAQLWREDHYLLDPHTAVAMGALGQYRVETGDDTPALVVSTASPFKFCPAVLEALGEKPVQSLESIAALAKVTGLTPPAPLAALSGKPVRFGMTCTKEQMAGIVGTMPG